MIIKNNQRSLGKRGQFYFIAILAIISIFIAFAVINNILFTTTKSSTVNLIDEIKIEKSQTLDYITFNNLTSVESQIIFINFSNSYMEKIGNDKDLFFLMGDNNNIKIIGQKTNDTSAFYFNGTEFIEMDTDINIDTPIINNKIEIKINNNTFEFEFYSGQNLYYLINYNYNKEVYIFYG